MNRLSHLKKTIVFICILFAITISQAFAEVTVALIKVLPIVTNNEVSVSVEYTNANMCGGSFNFIYDTTALQLVSIEEGETIKDTSHFINPEFAEGAIRINWVSATEMPADGILINIKFEMLDETFNKSDISIEKLKIADGDGNKQDAEYTVVYDILEEPEQIAPPTDNESEKNDPPSTTPSVDSSDVEQEAETKPESTDNNAGNTYAPSTRPSSDNSVAKQEDEIKISEDSIAFIDVSENDWFYANVQYVVEDNLMNGVSEDQFAPNNTLTRAMLVTVLYRNAGEPAVNKSIPFADVDMGSWYANAVVWAKQNGIVNGVNETDFAPDANITREQIATIMFRYAQFKGMDAVTLEENLHFEDSNEISEYAVSAMNWAVGTGLMKGKSDTTLNPLDNATRAEIAAILQRFIENNK